VLPDSSHKVPKLRFRAVEVIPITLSMVVVPLQTSVAFPQGRSVPTGGVGQPAIDGVDHCFGGGG
jgi:hypothetical protein